MITEAEIEKAIEWLSGNGRNAAKCRAEREYMDEYRGVIKAQIMRLNTNESLGAQEAIAKSDHKYVEHLKLWQECVEKDEYYRWMKATAEINIEAWRTQSSNERALSKI